MKRLFLFVFLFLSACSIYRSADRAEFESDAPALRIKSLQKTTCSQTSIAPQSQQSRLLTTINNEFLWEHRLSEQSLYESTDLKGTYCLYDVEFE